MCVYLFSRATCYMYMFELLLRSFSLKGEDDFILAKTHSQVPRPFCEPSELGNLTTKPSTLT